MLQRQCRHFGRHARNFHLNYFNARRNIPIRHGLAIDHGCRALSLTARRDNSRSKVNSAKRNTPIELTASGLAGCLYIDGVLDGVKHHQKENGDISDDSLFLTLRRLSQLKEFHSKASWKATCEGKNEEEVIVLKQGVRTALGECDAGRLHSLFSLCQELEWLERSDQDLIAPLTKAFSRLFLTEAKSTEELKSKRQQLHLCMSWPKEILSELCASVDVRSLSHASLCSLVDVFAPVRADADIKTLKAISEAVVKASQTATGPDQMAMLECLCKLELWDQAEKCLTALQRTMKQQQVDGDTIKLVQHLMPHRKRPAVNAAVNYLLHQTTDSKLSIADFYDFRACQVEYGLADFKHVHTEFYHAAQGLIHSPSTATEENIAALLRLVFVPFQFAGNQPNSDHLATEIHKLLSSPEADTKYSVHTRLAMFISTIHLQRGRLGTQKLDQAMYNKLLPEIREHLVDLTNAQLALFAYKVLPVLHKHNNLVAERWQCVAIAQNRIDGLSLSQLTNILFGLLRVETNLSQETLRAFLRRAAEACKEEPFESTVQSLCTLVDVLGWISRKGQSALPIVEFCASARDAVLHVVRSTMAQHKTRRYISLSILNQGLRNLQVLDPELLEGAVVAMTPVPKLLFESDDVHLLVNLYGIFSHFGIFTEFVQDVFSLMEGDLQLFLRKASLEDQVCLAYDCLLFNLVPKELLRTLLMDMNLTQLLKLSSLAQLKVLYFSLYLSSFYPHVEVNKKLLKLVRALTFSRYLDQLRIAHFHGWLSEVGPRKVIAAARSLVPDKCVLSYVALETGVVELLGLVLRPDTLDAVPWDHPEIIQHCSMVITGHTGGGGKGEKANEPAAADMSASQHRDDFVSVCLQSPFDSRSTHCVRVNAATLRERGLRPVLFGLVPAHNSAANSNLVIGPGVMLQNAARVEGWETAIVFTEELSGRPIEDMAKIMKKKLDLALEWETDRKVWQRDGLLFVG
ncbi:uncharacterized protein LOC135809849 [Sycon ciliatum]|uniref:uncharacterized protein LOC135809849 n=1 Tax=Sycon ciliatum TaxID=27933 RepID=UPI0031F678E2